MIITGMSLNESDAWEESQLTNDLQVIIAKYRNHFKGIEVVDCEEGHESEKV